MAEDRGLGLRQRGQVGVDYCRPFSYTGVASHRYPPWGDGRDAISHTMPHGGVSCPLFDVSSRHVSKTYPRKDAGRGGARAARGGSPSERRAGHPLWAALTQTSASDTLGDGDREASATHECAVSPAWAIRGGL